MSSAVVFMFFALWMVAFHPGGVCKFLPQLASRHILIKKTVF
jgi:hypothetical protein